MSDITALPPSTTTQFSEILEKLQSDMQHLTREIEQGQQVWQLVRSQEGQEWSTAIEAKQKSWENEENEWQNKKKAYEQKISELENFFQAQLKVTEQNALRAMNELDESWQRDKTLWQSSLTQSLSDARSREEAWDVQRQSQDAALQQLRQENQDLRIQLVDAEHQKNQLQQHWNGIQGQLAQFEQEKNAWQQSLGSRMEELTLREQQWTTHHQNQDLVITQLQQQINELHGRLRQYEQVRTAPVETYVNSLETQVAALNDFIRQYIPAQPSHPLRRKSDFLSVAKTLP